MFEIWHSHSSEYYDFGLLRYNDVWFYRWVYRGTCLLQLGTEQMASQKTEIIVLVVSLTVL